MSSISRIRLWCLLYYRHIACRIQGFHRRPGGGGVFLNPGQNNINFINTEKLYILTVHVILCGTSWLFYPIIKILLFPRLKESTFPKGLYCESPHCIFKGQNFLGVKKNPDFLKEQKKKKCFCFLRKKILNNHGFLLITVEKKRKGCGK